jgi:hypothetical protein
MPQVEIGLRLSRERHLSVAGRPGCLVSGRGGKGVDGVCRVARYH